MNEPIPQKSTQHKKQFLKAYREEFTIYHACIKIGVSRACYYKWYREDPEFVKAVDIAEKDIVNDLEREARRRAYEGVEKAVYQQGKEVGNVREYSDTLMIFLLKGLAPEKYRERTDINATIKADVEIKQIEVRLT
jgi:hypothetical protein